MTEPVITTYDRSELTGQTVFAAQVSVIDQ
jgi:hypothetical protein